MNCFRCGTDNNLLYIGESNGKSVHVCDQCSRREGHEQMNYPTSTRNGGSAFPVKNTSNALVYEKVQVPLKMDWNEPVKIRTASVNASCSKFQFFFGMTVLGYFLLYTLMH